MNTRPLNSPPRLAALAIALAASALLAACGGGGGPPQMPPTEVNVATVVAKRVAQWDEFTGRIEAIESVEIRPRVAGYLAGVHFEDGAVVQRGDLLFTIDDREYRAAADSAQAAVASAATRVEVARTEFARTEKLAAVRGMNDLLPADAPLWEWFEARGHSTRTSSVAGLITGMTASPSTSWPSIRSL